MIDRPPARLGHPASNFLRSSRQARTANLLCNSGRSKASSRRNRDTSSVCNRHRRDSSALKGFPLTNSRQLSRARCLPDNDPRRGCNSPSNPGSRCLRGRSLSGSQLVARLKGRDSSCAGPASNSRPLDSSRGNSPVDQAWVIPPASSPKISPSNAGP